MGKDEVRKGGVGGDGWGGGVDQSGQSDCLQDTVSMATESRCEPTDDHVQAEDMDATHGWTSVGVWQCPPLHFSQDEEGVSFVLHTVDSSHLDLQESNKMLSNCQPS